MELTINNESFRLDGMVDGFDLFADAITINLGGELFPAELSVENESLEANFGIITERDASHDYYDGSYTVTPKVTAQALKTADKVMRADVDVEAIPKYEVDNKQGTTVYIGSELKWQ